MSSLKILTLWLIALWAGNGPSWAVEITDGPSVSATSTEAVVKWTTDVECGTLVKFGLNRNNYNRQAGGPVSRVHEVRLTGLSPGTRYFFSAGTAKRSLHEGSFTTNSTRTRGSTPKITPGPTAPPPPAAKPTVRPAPVLPPPVPPATPEKPAYHPLATARTWGDRWSLQDHFNRHGADFGAANPDDYAAKAWLFLQRAKDEGLPAKLDESDGTIRVWDGRSRSFAAYNRDFTTKTFFKPGSPDYFNRQPGKPVRLRHAAPAKP